MCGVARADLYSSDQPAPQTSGEGTVVGAPPPTDPGPAAPALSPDDARHALVLAIVAAVALLSLWHTRTLDESRLSKRTDNLSAPPLLFLASALAAWSAWQVGGSLYAARLDASPAPATRDATLLILSAYSLALITLLVLLTLAKPLSTHLGLRPRARDLLIAPASLTIALPVVFLSTLLARFLASYLAARNNTPPPDNLAHNALQELFDPATPHNLWWWLTIASITLIAPLFEEFVYRAFLQTSIIRLTRSILPSSSATKRLGPVWLAISLTSAIFALAHLAAAPWYALPGLFLFGLSLGLVYERTGRLAPSILMHAGFNAINLLLASYIST